MTFSLQGDEILGVEMQKNMSEEFDCIEDSAMHPVAEADVSDSIIAAVLDFNFSV